MKEGRIALVIGSTGGGLIAAVIAIILLIVLAGDGPLYVDICYTPPTATATLTPTPTHPRIAALGRPTAPPTFPPTQTMIRHYFAPLGRADEALAYADCESTTDPTQIGPDGELGTFQLHPQGAGKPFIAAGWNLLDPQQNIIAAAIIVARDGGWSEWPTNCYP